jgi:hypothetical protein
MTSVYDEISTLLFQGMTRQEAAEDIAEREGGVRQPAAILRMFSREQAKVLASRQETAKTSGKRANKMTKVANTEMTLKMGHGNAKLGPASRYALAAALMCLGDNGMGLRKKPLALAKLATRVFADELDGQTLSCSWAKRFL